MQLPSRSHVKYVQKKILTYYKENGRDLPWRTTTDPYKILVSEIMLQQTHVDRVIPFYTTWIRKWPTIHDLAAAPRTDVLKAWLGLGYNNRAIRLHDLAKKVSNDYNGDLLTALDQEKLPGIGSYTKRAIAIFAMNKDLIAIDTNIRRILIHEFNFLHSITDQELEDVAMQCLPKGKSREWHNALMDYGATVLTSRKTGIKPKTTQSKFEGSDRQIRAQILRYLLTTQAMPPIQKLQTHFKKISPSRLHHILTRMEKDGLLVCFNGRYPSGQKKHQKNKNK